MKVDGFWQILTDITGTNSALATVIIGRRPEIGFVHQADFGLMEDCRKPKGRLHGKDKFYSEEIRG